MRYYEHTPKQPLPCAHLLCIISIACLSASSLKAHACNPQVLAAAAAHGHPLAMYCKLGKDRRAIGAVCSASNKST